MFSNVGFHRWVGACACASKGKVVESFCILDSIFLAKLAIVPHAKFFDVVAIGCKIVAISKQRKLFAAFS